MTPASRIEAMFFGVIAIIAFAGAAVLLWRACEVCRAWWLR